MSALLTYRSRNSFESRFGRNTPDPSRRQNINGSHISTSPSNEHWAVHNEGHRRANPSRSTSANNIHQTNNTSGSSSASNGVVQTNKRPTTYFSAQSYLRYQGSKFVSRFDSNCYIATTRKLDTHDISRSRVDPASPTPIADALSQIQQPTLVIGIESDGLFTFAEQQELAAGIPNARLRTIDSPEGHDAFLLQFEQVNRHILEFLRDVLPDLMAMPAAAAAAGDGDANGVMVVNEEEDGALGDDDEQMLEMRKKGSLFGEAEGEKEREVEDITAW